MLLWLSMACKLNAPPPIDLRFTARSSQDTKLIMAICLKSAPNGIIGRNEISKPLIDWGKMK